MDRHHCSLIIDRWECLLLVQVDHLKLLVLGLPILGLFPIVRIMFTGCLSCVLGFLGVFVRFCKPSLLLAYVTLLAPLLVLVLEPLVSPLLFVHFILFSELAFTLVFVLFKDAAVIVLVRVLTGPTVLGLDDLALLICFHFQEVVAFLPIIL